MWRHVFFFFSSRRRHTRWNCDWSSDVCSSDLYVKFANENVLVIVIIEQKQAIENIEEIASVPGVDVLFIGANDLSFSLGVGGKLTDPVVEEAVAKVLAAGKKHN